MRFAAKNKRKRNVPNQDKQTPHTVLQKLSPKTLRTPLNHCPKTKKFKFSAAITKFSSIMWGQKQRYVKHENLLEKDSQTEPTKMKCAN